MKKYPLLAFLCMALIGTATAQSLTSYVNPFIGTDNYGATNPGAVMPWGMVSVSPFNVAGPANLPIEKDSRWHSTPYWHGNPFLTGFSHVNLSGVGCPDLGSLLLMPTTGPLTVNHLAYGSTFDQEVAKPGYYSTFLKKHNVKAEMTATMRSGRSRYTFPAGESHILLNLGLGLTNESGAALHFVSPQEIEGYKMIGNFCYNEGSERPVYFVMRVDKFPEKYGLWKKQPANKGVEKDWNKYQNQFKYYEGFEQWLAGDSVGVYLTFTTSADEMIEVQIGVSYVSIKNARENLDTEQPDGSFDQFVGQADDAWEEELSRVKVEGGSTGDKTKFYTALYHVLLHPNVLQDVNGQYPLMGGKGTGQVLPGQNRYTVFSLWDTYRNVHPLLSLLYPERQLDMVRSMVDMYREHGWLPKWELLSNETGVMVGDPATIVITDSYLRGLTDFDTDAALHAMLKAASEVKDNPLRPGNAAYLDEGYLPIDGDGKEKVWGSLSTTLEYNLADWNLAHFAKEMDLTSDYHMFLGRSMSYKKFYDPELSILRPLMADGSFIEEFDPEYGMNFEPVPGFVEGTAWMYTFFVPHDMPGRIELGGGADNFVSQLQRCFDDSLFSMHNEPDIAYPFLFNYVEGEEWRSQQAVHNCVEHYFHTGPGGIPGNDDTGTLSAWLIYAMMGFYPDCPGKMDYALATPVFDRISISLNSDHYPSDKLEIVTEGTGHFIKKMWWNGKRYKSYFLNHNEMVKGGVWKVQRYEK